MRLIEGEERDALILEILNRIDADTQVIGAPERTETWERGWNESLERFRSLPEIASLIPAFIRPHQAVRFQKQFFMPTGNEELDHVRVMQTRIGTMLQDCPNIAEFGSGTGYNLAKLATRFPQKNFHAFDFAPSAVELAELIRNKLNLNIYGHQFDMTKPEGDIRGGYGAFTFGAIEQLAGNFVPFMEFLLEQRPRMVVHVEPTIELYDPANLVDALAIKFHRKRGYTEGMLPWLQNDPRVEVLQVERTFFGSLMMEGYSMIVWVPK
jgi:hypothetical protein